MHKNLHIPLITSVESKHIAVKDATNMQFEEKCQEYTKIFDEDYVEENEDVPAKLKQSIKDIVKKEGYVNYMIDIKCIPADGGNYLARLFEIHVDGTTKDGRKETDIFVKYIVPGELFTFFSVAEAYRKEVYAYTELLKIYDKLQIEARVPFEQRLKIVKNYEESDKELVIMENIAKKGFTTLNRLETISFEFAKLSVEQLAKFHALLLVLEKKQPEYFNRKVKSHKTCFTFSEDWNKFIENFCRISMETLDHEMKNKVEKIIPMVIEKLPDYQLNTNTVCCLCHGDFRSNNIMMKMNDNGIEEVIVIDYQFIQYSSPINDLLYFIAGATDQQFRRDHLETIKDIYHNTLGDFLKYFDMDVDNIFSRKTFEKLYKERLDYGLLTAVWFLPVVLADTEDIPDFSKQCATDIKFKTHKSLKDRLEGVIDDYVKWGYL